MEELKQCPICNHSTFNIYSNVKDHSVSKEEFKIVECTQCNFTFTNPRPESGSIVKYYESDDYISHTDKPKNLTQRIYKIARKFTLKSKINLITKFKKKGNLLDYGCGTGDFLHIAKSKGWSIMGLEINNKAREISQKKNGSDSIVSDIKELKNLKFDIITLWHVLEHVHDLNPLMSELKNKLKQNGKIIVAVPNYRCADQQYYKENWAGWDVPRHLYHFDQDSMKKLISKHKMKLAGIYPMYLDSFYVSLLSEEYKSGKQKYIPALINGFISNIKAIKNKNYSSLIYVIEL